MLFWGGVGHDPAVFLQHLSLFRGPAGETLDGHGGVSSTLSRPVGGGGGVFLGKGNLAEGRGAAR